MTTFPGQQEPSSNGATGIGGPYIYKIPEPRPDWLSLYTEEALEPGLPIIDAHHHLGNDRRGPYRFDELVEDTGSGHNIIATVSMEAGAM